jgi:hypothetical protein
MREQSNGAVTIAVALAIACAVAITSTGTVDRIGAPERRLRRPADAAG